MSDRLSGKQILKVRFHLDRIQRRWQIEVDHAIVIHFLFLFRAIVIVK